MKAHRRILTQHRFQRLVLWTLAMLSWFAAVLLSRRPITKRHLYRRGDVSLAWLRLRVRDLLIIRAAEMLGRVIRRPNWRNARMPSHFRRSLVGARLRRALKHKDPATHIAKLVAVLRNLDAHAAELARHIRTRRRRLCHKAPSIAPAVALFGAPALTPALADSS